MPIVSTDVRIGESSALLPGCISNANLGSYLSSHGDYGCQGGMDSSMCRGQALLSPTWKPSTRGLRLVLSHTARDPDPPVWRPRCSQGGDTASMLPVDQSCAGEAKTIHGMYPRKSPALGSNPQTSNGAVAYSRTTHRPPRQSRDATQY